MLLNRKRYLFIAVFAVFTILILSILSFSPEAEIENRYNSRENYFTNLATSSGTQYEEEIIPETSPSTSSSSGCQSNGPGDPPIDPIGTGDALVAYDYLRNQTDVTNPAFDEVQVNATSTTDPTAYELNFSSPSDSSRLVYTDFTLYNIRSINSSDRIVEDDPGSFGNDARNRWFAQGFNITASTDYVYIDGVTFGQFYIEGSTFTFEIRNSTGSSPGGAPGSVLYTKTLPSFDYSNTYVPFSEPILIKTNRYYYVTVDMRGHTKMKEGFGKILNAFDGGRDDGPTYYWGGASWIEETDRDQSLYSVRYRKVHNATSLGMTINGNSAQDATNYYGAKYTDNTLNELPDGNGLVKFDVDFSKSLEVIMDANCTVIYRWGTTITDASIFNVTGGNHVDWNVTYNAAKPTSGYATGVSQSWYDYFFGVDIPRTDWTVTHVLDPTESDVITQCDYIDGAYVNVTADGYSGDGTWKLQFESPNYVNFIETQNYTGSDFQPSTNFLRGEKIRVVANFEDGNSNPVDISASYPADLNITYLQPEPDGALDYRNVSYHSKYVIDGTGNVTFANHTFSGDIGKYYVHVYWHNGTEVGFQAVEIYVSGYVITVSTPTVSYTGDSTQEIDITGVTANCSNPAHDVLDDGEAIDNTYTVYTIGGSPTSVTGNLSWTGSEWQALDVDVSSLSEGEYYVKCYFTDSDASGISVASNTFFVVHVLTVSTPTVSYTGGATQEIVITGVKATCSNLAHDELNNTEATVHTYIVYTSLGVYAGVAGTLTWNTIDSAWEVLDGDVSSLSEGSYYVKCYFEDIDAEGMSAQSNTFTIVHTVTVSAPTVSYIGDATQKINITGVVGTCSYSVHGTLDDIEATTHTYTVYTDVGTPTGITGDLLWTGSLWQILDVDVSSLSSGKYYVRSYFQDVDADGTSAPSNTFTKGVFDITVSVPTISYIGGTTQQLDITGVTATCSNPAHDVLDDNEATVYNYTIYTSGGVQTGLIGDLVWTGSLWQALDVDVSSLSEGDYYVRCVFEDSDASGISSQSATFTVVHIITVSIPSVTYDNSSQTIDIFAITAVCSYQEHDTLDDSEATTYTYRIYTSSGTPTSITGSLTWDNIDSKWIALDVDVSGLSDGDYYVRCYFEDMDAEGTSPASTTFTKISGGGNGGNGGDGSDGSGGSSGGGGSSDGGGGGGTTVIQTLRASVTYPEETEKYVAVEVVVFLTDDEGAFVSNGSVLLTFGNEAELLELEEKDGYYIVFLETDTLDIGNYNFTISAEKSGFRNYISSAFPFEIVVKYPFATSVQHPEYWPEVRKDPVSLMLDPFLYITPAIAAILITLQVTTFSSIDPRKLRSIYIFTPEGQGIYYRTFLEDAGFMDSDLISAALSGITSLVMEATRSEKPVKTIDIETLEIFLEYGQFITTATFVGKRIFYKRKIRRGQRKLINEIERKYSHILRKWDGSLSHFSEMDQLVLGAFDFQVTNDLAKMIFDAAQAHEERISHYASLDMYHMAARNVWKAYELYTKIDDSHADFIIHRWKALEKAYLVDYLGLPNTVKTQIASKIFKLLDFVRTPALLKLIYYIRSIIHPELSKELYHIFSSEQLTEGTEIQ